MLHLLLYGALALVLAALLFAAAARFLPAGEQIAPPVRDEPPWDLPPERALNGADVDAVRLPVALRGYRFAETDQLLDRLATELRARDAEIARLRGEEPLDEAPAVEAAVAPAVADERPGTPVQLEKLPAPVPDEPPDPLLELAGPPAVGPPPAAGEALLGGALPLTEEGPDVAAVPIADDAVPVVDEPAEPAPPAEAAPPAAASVLEQDDELADELAVEEALDETPPPAAPVAASSEPEQEVEPTEPAAEPAAAEHLPPGSPPPGPPRQPPPALVPPGADPGRHWMASPPPWAVPQAPWLAPPPQVTSTLREPPATDEAPADEPARRRRRRRK